MTGPKGISEFCFPDTLNVPRGEAARCGASHSVFVIPPNSKIKKKLRKNRLLDAGWHTNLPRFQGARPDHVRVESSCCCFPRNLVNFDPRHMISFPPIRKRIWGEFERVTGREWKLTDSPGRTKVTNSPGKQQHKLSTRTWSGRAPWNRGKFVSQPG